MYDVYDTYMQQTQAYKVTVTTVLLESWDDDRPAPHYHENQKRQDAGVVCVSKSLVTSFRSDKYRDKTKATQVARG